MGHRQLLPVIAVVAVTYTLGSILLATILSPEFAWRSNALSHLGVPDHDAGTPVTAILFNGGLIGGGFLGTLFSMYLFMSSGDIASKAISPLLGVTFLLLGLVGVFPSGTRPHFPLAVGFFLFVTITLWVHGFISLHTKEYRWASISFVAGTGNILTWILWPIVSPNPLALAIPEIIGATIFSAWVCLFAKRLAKTATVIEIE